MHSNPRAAARALSAILPLAAVGLSLVLPIGAAHAAPRQDAAPAAIAPEGRGQVRGLTTWDDAYLYLSFRIDDPDVLGTNKAPLSDPTEDDSVGVYLQMDGKKPGAPDANTYAMLVSAAGGFTFLEGDPQTKAFKVKSLFSIKYAVSIQGTLNRSDDRDQGYTVEMAIPWSGLGLDKPEDRARFVKEGAQIGINVVVRDRENKSLASLADGVKSEADVANPSKWTRLTLTAAGATDAPGGGLFAPRIAPGADGKETPPLIDGALRVANEWPAASRFPFGAPERSTVAATPTTKAPTAAPSPDAEAPALKLDDASLAGSERLLMARYVLDYQADPRKPTPFRGVIDPMTGQFLIADDPASGIGPWFSTDRVGWHKQQLADMKRAGVDVALVCLGGPDADGALLDEKSLLVLVTALREMAVEGEPAPLLVPCIETTKLVPPGPAKPDLSTDDGHALLYRAVRRWFALVPPEMRARVQLPLAAGGVGAYPLYLSDGRELAGVNDADWAANLRKRFAAEFGAESRGTTLLIAGGPGFGQSPGVVATTPLLDGGVGKGALPTYVVRPGLDAPGGQLVPRKESDTYYQSWEDALSAKPVWTIIDSWNDFARGTEVAESRQYGPRYLDLTRVFAVQAGNLPERDVRWLGNDAPRRLRPGQVVTTTLTIQNGGKLPISEEQGVYLTYRWFDTNGRAVSEAPLPLRFVDSLLPTQARRVTLGLAALTVGPDGQLAPLAPGRYVAQIDMARPADPTKPDGPKRFFADDGDVPLSIPVEVTANAPGGLEFASATTPTMMQTGGTYPVVLRARWTGEGTIRADQAQLTWQLLSSDGSQTIATGAANLAEDLTPGAPTLLRAIVKLTDNGGAPLPPSFPELAAGLGTPGGGYRLRWLLTRTNSTEAVPGVYEERVAVYGGDEEARVIAPADLPPALDADSTTPVKVTVVNRGPNRWAKGEFLVGYHWYYADGVEAAWKGGIPGRIPKDVAPGESVTVTVPVQAPAHDGPYVLAFDVARAPDTYLSQRPVTRTGDMGLVYVRVVGGRLAYVDLAKLFDTDAVAPEGKPTDGDMNGNGSTFPAESFPPDRYGLNAPGAPVRLQQRPGDRKPRFKNPPPPAYPSGYYAEVSQSARRISFRYGPDADGQKNAVACRGQVVPLPGGRYTGLHLAAAATGGEDRDVALKLTYKDKTTETVTVRVGDWGRAPVPQSEAIAISARRRRTPQGDVAGVAAVRHVVCRVNPGKELASVTLPDDPKVKVFAMTLDQ